MMRYNLDKNYNFNWNGTTFNLCFCLLAENISMFYWKTLKIKFDKIFNIKWEQVKTTIAKASGK